MLDPHAGRARVVQDADKLIIKIKGKRHVFISAFLGFWLIGWAFGWVMVSGILLSGTAEAGALFLMVWLCAWTIGGIVTLAQFFWLVAGYETIEISTQQVTIKRHIPFWSKKVDCRFEDLKRLRAVEATGGFQANKMANWVSRKTGNIQMDYGVHSIGFGIELDTAEAQKIVNTVTAVFPELATEPTR